MTVREKADRAYQLFTENPAGHCPRGFMSPLEHAGAVILCISILEAIELIKLRRNEIDSASQKKFYDNVLSILQEIEREEEEHHPTRQELLDILGKTNPMEWR
jgi:hypothetical protein